VHGRVADIDADAGALTVGEPGREAVGHACPGFFPGRFLQSSVASHQRSAQAIRIGMQIAERDTLGTQVAATEDVFAVAAYAHYAFVADADGKAAGRFAQGAGAVDSAGVGVTGGVHDGCSSRIRRAAAPGRRVAAV